MSPLPRNHLIIRSMAVFVDPMRSYPGRRGVWCHMMADSLEELHQMAESIGLRREWFQDHPLHPHYDLHPLARALAVQQGAVEVSSIEMARHFRRKYL